MTRSMMAGAAAACAVASLHAAAQTMAGMAMAAPKAAEGATMQADMQAGMQMAGDYGPYPMSREASGTSWQPQSTPDGGLHAMLGQWMVMIDGSVDAVYDEQGGRRGARKVFSPSMLMVMGQRALGARGTLGLRAMVSLDPLMGPNGYPLLFATGETADGRTPLVDRQHPHDLFMELAATYSYRLGERGSVFVYGGLPGEPALGPPAFMHRFSGMDNPEAPITHHWLDSTHITYGVLTGGAVLGAWKLEGSVFRGREPNQERYDVEAPALDSAAVRLSWNPGQDWSLQASYGALHSPEQLAPGVDEQRLTASAIYNRAWRGGDWSTTLAWGRKMNTPGHTLDGVLLESAVVAGLDMVFARAERVDEDELFDGVAPLAGRVFTVSALTVGYIRDVAVAPHLRVGVGGLATRYAFPAALDRAYGAPTSLMLFVRVKLS